MCVGCVRDGGNSPYLYYVYVHFYYYFLFAIKINNTANGKWNKFICQKHYGSPSSPASSSSCMTMHVHNMHSYTHRMRWRYQTRWYLMIFKNASMNAHECEHGPIFTGRTGRVHRQFCWNNNNWKCNAGNGPFCPTSQVRQLQRHRIGKTFHM